jgi:hypothetical protein
MIYHDYVVTLKYRDIQIVEFGCVLKRRLSDDMYFHADST